MDFDVGSTHTKCLKALWHSAEYLTSKSGPDGTNQGGRDDTPHRTHIYVGMR
jgi:hypothetical protein